MKNPLEPFWWLLAQGALLMLIAHPAWLAFAYLWGCRLLILGVIAHFAMQYRGD